MNQSTQHVINSGCYSILESTRVGDLVAKYSPIMIERGSTYFHKTNWIWNCTWDTAVKAVRDLNEGLGITEPERLAFETCSMFNRWANYDNILKMFQSKIK